MLEFTLPSQSSSLKHCQTAKVPAPDGAELAHYYWQGVPGKPVVAYFHGIEGHSQWFADTAYFLNQHGLSVYAFDRRGSGLNSADRGHARSADQLLADVEGAIDFVEKSHPGAPLFVLGNCWGAKCAILAAKRLCSVQSGEHLSGLILTAPAIKTIVNLPLATKIDIFFAWLFRSPKLFPIPITPEMFTKNPVWLDYIYSDPFRLTQATGSFFVSSTILSFLSQQAPAKLTCPTLVLQAVNDQIVDWQYVKSWFDAVASSDKSFICFPDSDHSLDFSTSVQKYWDCLYEWICRHAVSRKAI